MCSIAFSLLFDPFFLLDTFLCILASGFSIFLRLCGFGVWLPFESYAKLLIPTSMPIDFENIIFGMQPSDSDMSTVKHANHFPDFDLVIITCLIFALSGISLC